MGRQSRRKDDPHRGDRLGYYGRPMTLADQLQVWPIDLPRVDGFTPLQAQQWASGAARFSIPAVADYFEQTLDSGWSWEGLPSLRLPFDKVLIEYPYPGATAGSNIGAFVCEGLPPAEAIRLIRDSGSLERNIDRTSFESMEQEAAASHTLFYRLFLSYPHPPRVVGDVSQGFLFLDEEYSAVTQPTLGMCRGVMERFSLAGDPWQILIQAVFPMFLAIALLNCRNITVTAHEPDPRVNRQRRSVGLRPWLRYSTIDLGPMREVLRTEGRVAEVGITQAMRLVRGHFARYTEDRPLFGRPGLHGDFWIPWHTKGDLGKGVTLSDYTVHAPAPPMEAIP